MRDRDDNLAEKFDNLEQAEPLTSSNEDSINGSIQSEQSTELQGAVDQVQSTNVPESPEPTQYSQPQSKGSVPTIEPQTHELGAHLLFANIEMEENGHFGSLSPYFSIASEYESSLADKIGEFCFDDEPWKVVPSKTRYWNGEIAAPNQSYESFNEYQISVSTKDGLGERKATFQFRPSVPVAKNSAGDRIGSMPEDLPYGLRVQVSSSNLELDEVLPLLQCVAKNLGIRSEYFSDDILHEYSSVYQLAMYLRIEREQGEQYIVNKGGILDQLGLFGRNNRGKGEYKWNNERVLGHMNSVAFDEGTWSNLTGKSQTAAKRVKYYHPEHTRSSSTEAVDDALRDPKLEIQFNTKFSSTKSVPWDSDSNFDANDLYDELDESIINILYWAGLSTRADPTTYTCDQYFRIEESERDLNLVANRMPQIRETEEEQTVAHFARGDVTESERLVLASLAMNGQQADVELLADMSETSRSTVYRAINKFGDLMEVVSGKVSFSDEVIRKKFNDLLGVFEDVTEWVVGGVQDLGAKDSEIIDPDSPLARWARRHCVTIQEKSGKMLVDISGKPLSRIELWRLLRAGVKLANETGDQAYTKFLNAYFSYHEKGEGRKSRQSPINSRGAVFQV